MEKIGILTFNRTVNYGAVLQGYALEETFKKSGADALLINYENSFVEGNETIKFRLGKGFVKRFVRSIQYRKKYKKFYKFIDSISSEKIYKRKDFLNGERPAIDKIVVGSDQVWNFKCSGKDHTFLLDCFGGIKKYSYAASFGVSWLPEEQVPVFKDNLSKIEKISIREKTGEKILNEQLGLESNVVLDPTLLLTKSEWKERMSINENGKKYILVYAIQLSEPVKKIAMEMSKLYNVPIYNISQSAKDFWGDKCIKNAGPHEWIDLFLGASFVVTDSFHGTAFSVNFNKQFYAYANNEKKSRIVDLLQTLELEDRRISDISEIDSKKQIDYNRVNEKLNEERKKSLEFIESIIND